MRDTHGALTSEMAVTLRPEADVRSLIDAANRAVELRGFNESQASMNDVFISMVKDSEQ